MVSPLDTVIPISSVCSALKLGVDSGTPDVYRCPLCSRGLIRPFAEPDHGTWWFCRQCRYSGPSLAFYQRARNLPGVKDAWLDLIRESDLRPGQHLLLPGAMATHRAAQDNLAQQEDFWAACSLHALHHLPMTVDLLQEAQLLERADCGTYRSSMGQLLGAVDREAMDRMTGLIDMRGLEVGFRNGLVLRYESSPGLTSAYLFAGRRRGTTIWQSKHVRQQQEETGLLALGAVSCETYDRVYLVHDPMLVLQMHRRWLKDCDRFAPVLGFAATGGEQTIGHTRRAYSALGQREAVFWDRDVMLCIAGGWAPGAWWPWGRAAPSRCATAPPSRWWWPGTSTPCPGRRPSSASC